MIYLILGISLTLNVIMIISIFIYLKIKTLGMKKVENEFKKTFFYRDNELDDMLDKL